MLCYDQHVNVLFCIDHHVYSGLGNPISPGCTQRYRRIEAPAEVANIRRAGESIANEVAQDLHKFAVRKGIDRALVDELLDNNHDMIVDRLGGKYADEFLGEPDPNEGYD